MTTSQPFSLSLSSWCLHYRYDCNNVQVMTKCQGFSWLDGPIVATGCPKNWKIILCQTKQATRPKQQYQLQSNIIFQYFLDTIHVSFKCIHVCHGHGTALWVGGRRENSIPNAHVTSRYIVDYLHCICWSCAWLLSWIMDYQNPLN